MRLRRRHLQEVAAEAFYARPTSPGEVPAGAVVRHRWLEVVPSFDGMVSSHGSTIHRLVEYELPDGQRLVKRQ